MATPFVPGSSASISSEVELTISVRNLHGADVLSKSDPFCVTYTQPFGTQEWIEYHRTETIQNNHNPDFVSKITLPYRFEEQQPLKFEIYDSDSTARRLSDHDFLGFTTCTLAQIVSSGGKVSKVTLPLQIRNDYGKIHSTAGSIVVSAEELAQSNDEIVMQLTGQHLDKKDWFGKSDPFLEIYKSSEGGDYVLVHKTEVIKSTLNPRWKKFVISAKTLCNADFKRVLKFRVWDWNMSGNNSLIGEFMSTVDDLSASVPSRFSIIHPEKKLKKSSYKNSGEIILEHFEVQRIYSFMDYITGGVQIHCSVAIDFTGSNGDPVQPSSLHFIGGGSILNYYEQAITSIVSIIQDYDSDKQFPVLGFGARLPPDGRVSHEFFVNMTDNPFCCGVNGVLDAYRSCIRMVQLYGPTNFSPVIEHVIKFARSYADGNNYFILLILTDGVISDMPNTVKSIIAASSLPISIIIIGIGNADFTAMEVLDADKICLESGGVKARRDIVQFVPFSRFLSQGDPHLIRQRLAKEVLAEIPRQLVTYMRYEGFVPSAKVRDVVQLPPNPELL